MEQTTEILGMKAILKRIDRAEEKLNKIWEKLVETTVAQADCQKAWDTVKVSFEVRRSDKSAPSVPMKLIQSNAEVNRYYRELIDNQQKEYKKLMKVWEDAMERYQELKEEGYE